MKFAHRYSHTLESEGFPLHWVRCAISYRQLKKCIKRIRDELAELGLPPEILNHLWLSEDVRDSIGKSDTSIVGFSYSFLSCPSGLAPKLTFLIDPNESHIPESLSAETREYLRILLGTSGKQAASSTSETSVSLAQHVVVSCGLASGEMGKSFVSASEACKPIQEVEIPLHSDSEFFQILKEELSILHDLQERERKELDSQVKHLRDSLVETISSHLSWSRPTLSTWREIFRLYIDSQVFFSTDELDSGERTSTVAHQQLVKFQSSLSENNRYKKLGKNGRVVLESFLKINFVLLQSLKFQEINRIALRKILKKFDKRTALRAYPAIPLLEPLLARNVAKILCQTISQELLSIVPQITDYLCPICLSISFKPVRLRCNHVFCIRCLVIMQRAQQNQCALCRREVVMEATSDNLDQELLAFLSTVFPKETRIKQKENERAARMDLYGNTYDACTVM
ncbi:uncharacterized protein CIMG_11925 [Coccidioides immitis RS]|uniref:RING-14 protein n=3 Tax=Coccidioides immitis TaxID=5501 RepID=A0A0D8JTS3_COCIM|nr:uncharacterized protein CIMG_11925 [Coccidioides immitis RS]KJF60682.1 hypothetical protein CIMG_11925 [Coccidioides immitis RS]KMP02363.1 hypothetical protein CIRG_10186 [Coccidioides immitis RMSCC 2394]